MLSLEKEQMEAAKAKQDVKLAYLRAEANNQQSSDEVDVSQKARLEVAKARHASIVSQLNSVKKVLETMQGGSISLARKRDTAIRTTEEVLPLSNDVVSAVEVLILELITSRESLASVHAAYMEAEEQTIVLALATDEDAFICGEELKQAEERILWLKEKILMAKNLKSELGTASNNLLNLQNELASYMIEKLQQESGTMGEGHLKGGAVEGKKTGISVETSNHSDVELEEVKVELEEVKIHTEEAEDQVICLKVAATSLESALENEKAALASMKQTEEMVSAVISSLQSELDRTISEVKLAVSKHNEARQQMVQLPEALQKATREADEAKSVARFALEELQKAKEEATRAKASAITIEGRLHAVSKEIEALKASEGLALAAVQAMEESEQAANTDDSSGRVDLPLDEYYMLSNRARDAEECADERAAVALSRMGEAKVSELRIFKKLQAMIRELGERKEAVWVATRKAEEIKLATEQELRMQRSEHDQRIKKQDDVAQTAADSPRNFEQEQAAGGRPVGSAPASKILQENGTDSAAMSGSAGRKKRSLFPHLVMLFARKKA